MIHIAWINALGGHTAHANSVALYTPYTELSVPPGESIDYSIEVINNSGSIRDVAISLSGLPEGWDYSLKSGGWSIGKISVLPGEKKSLSLKVEVPLKIEKGTYNFKVIASGFTVLPLTINVSETGTFRTEFTSNQANIEGHSNTTFTYNAKLKNMTAEPQLYALRSNAPRGWNVNFKANGKQVSSVNVEANHTQDLTIEVNPPSKIKADTYKIPIQAYTNASSADLELETVIKGSYEMELTTPTGLLSSNITSGGEKRVELLVRNTGSSPISGIKLDRKVPVDWDVIFEPNEISSLEPGENTKVFATIKASSRAIPGDYMATLEAHTPEVTERASFRVSVKTSMVMGWFGFTVILVVLGGIYHLFQKYGRR
ncbi:NEW3 domain-containing protein [Negadavirga shengliensis]|uniref:NEW3 domain-containing protein n=2 Tax=Negadavirga shengliensis TaxID=1389218 RepID=A0ABV9T5F0_9BACT